MGQAFVGRRLARSGFCLLLNDLAIRQNEDQVGHFHLIHSRPVAGIEGSEPFTMERLQLGGQRVFGGLAEKTG